MLKWDERFLALAATVAEWSRDPSKKVGAVIVDDKKRVVSVGYNGFPQGVSDDERLNDKETKNEITVHAEINAILFANRNLEGCTIYVWPIPPCVRCAGQILQAGIKRVVSCLPEDNDTWKASVLKGRALLIEGAAETSYFPPDEETQYVRIWSFEHDAWWRPGSMGYTRDKGLAGLYRRADAEEICERANCSGTTNEVIVGDASGLKQQARSLIEDINEQDNRATASPYYFAVQELQWLPDPEGYNFGEESREVVVVDGDVYDRDEYRVHVNEDRGGEPPISDEEFETLWEESKETQAGIWITKGIFLTEKAADTFIRGNSYKFGTTRTYVEHFYRNNQISLVFKVLEEFSGARIRRRR